MICLDEFCKNSSLRNSEVTKSVLYLSDILKNHIFKKDKIYIDSYAQKMIISNIKKGRKKNDQ